jgi:hypothetical protein
MVTANKSLLKLVRRLAAKDELAAMRLRGRLVNPAADNLLRRSRPGCS